MERIHSSDMKPGRIPDIHFTGTDITFLMNPGFSDDDLRLTIRCDGDGNVWASIQRVKHREKS